MVGNPYGLAMLPSRALHQNEPLLGVRFRVWVGDTQGPIVDFLRRLRADTRNLDDLRQSQRDFLLQLFMKFDGARSKILIDFARQVAADTRNVMQPSLL